LNYDCFILEFPYFHLLYKSLIIGLSQYSNKKHICRSILEAACYQTKEIIESIEFDSHLKLKVLKADGGMSNSSICMQFQSDILGIDVGK
jgi:glycerol kinase